MGGDCYDCKARHGLGYWDAIQTIYERRGQIAARKWMDAVNPWFLPNPQ